MQIVVNEQFVKSRVKIGNTAHLVSMGLLIVGFILSVVYPNYGVEFLFGAYMAMILALLVLSYSRNFTRRWGSRFRQDAQLVPGLRGLDNHYTMFNYPGPDLPDHLVVGPTGAVCPGAQGQLRHHQVRRPPLVQGQPGRRLLPLPFGRGAWVTPCRT